MLWAASLQILLISQPLCISFIPFPLWNRAGEEYFQSPELRTSCRKGGQVIIPDVIRWTIKLELILGRIVWSTITVYDMPSD